MSIAAIVLAAGSSSRLGRPKQTLLLGGETLLQRAVRVAEDAALSPILVVVSEGIAAPANAITRKRIGDDPNSDSTPFISGFRK